MKDGIHPKYHEVEARCACGATWKTRSTKHGAAPRNLLELPPVLHGPPEDCSTPRAAWSGSRRSSAPRRPSRASRPRPPSRRRSRRGVGLGSTRSRLSAAGLTGGRSPSPAPFVGFRRPSLRSRRSSRWRSAIGLGRVLLGRQRAARRTAGPTRGRACGARGGSPAPGGLPADSRAVRAARPAAPPRRARRIVEPALPAAHGSASRRSASTRMTGSMALRVPRRTRQSRLRVAKHASASSARPSRSYICPIASASCGDGTPPGPSVGHPRGDARSTRPATAGRGGCARTPPAAAPGRRAEVLEVARRDLEPRHVADPLHAEDGLLERLRASNWRASAGRAARPSARRCARVAPPRRRHSRRAGCSMSKCGMRRERRLEAVERDTASR